MQIVKFYNDTLKNQYGVVQNGVITPIANSIFDANLKIINERRYQLSEVKLDLPVQPSKIIGVAINYQGASQLSDNMSEPLVFLKGTNALCLREQDVILPFQCPTWGEVELGVIIKRVCENIFEEEAEEYILGYITANDVTSQNIDGRDHHLARSKSANNFCPISPYIETEYDFSDKKVKAYHNDILIREGNLSNMIWNPYKIISWLSSWMILLPGDIILTGTPPRVRDRLYLTNNDTFTCEIEGLPKISSKFIYA